MKAYGKPRHESAGRTIKGTSRPCPCCEIRKGHGTRLNKRRARAEGKKEAKDIEAV